MSARRCAAAGVACLNAARGVACLNAARGVACLNAARGVCALSPDSAAPHLPRCCVCCALCDAAMLMLSVGVSTAAGTYVQYYWVGYWATDEFAKGSERPGYW